MNGTESFLKWYICGYLNIYYNHLSLIGHDYKYVEFKIQRTIDYLNIKARYRPIFIFVFKHFGILESIISILIVTGQFIYLLMGYFFTKRKKLCCRKFFYMIGKDRILDILPKTDINEGELAEVFVFGHKNKHGARHEYISVLSTLSLNILWNSFILSSFFL